MDKAHTMQVAWCAGLPIPKTLIHTTRTRIGAAGDFGYPRVLKVATGSRGTGVVLCNDANQLDAQIGMIKTLDQNRSFLVQEYVRECPGRDLRILVIGGKAVAAMMREARNGDFRANISAGGVGSQFSLTPEITETSERLADLLGLRIAGVDLLFSTSAQFVVCEANSAPRVRGL